MPTPAIRPLQGTFAEVLRVSLPLVAGSASVAVKLFCDRLMLAQHGEVAISAAMPAGLVNFMFMTVFIGTAGYAQTFVAQYLGAERWQRCGLAAWQGIYVALIGGLLLATGPFWSTELFAFIGHAPAVQEAEVVYFNILSTCALFPILMQAFASFWGGRGQTWVIMLQGMLTAGLNIVFNWLLIDGHLGFPALGIAGAAMGTALADGLGVLILLVLFLRRTNREDYGSWPARSFDAALFRRLLYFGIPRGLQVFIDIAAFNIFVMAMGRYGVEGGLQAGVTAGNPQEAANICFSINGFAFIPLVGLGQGVAILVGQAMGAGTVPIVKRLVRRSLVVALCYMGAMASTMFTVPELLLGLFARPDDSGQVDTLALAVHMLRLVATWGLFDAVWVVYLSALQGAGDTRFTMVVNLLLAWVGFALPLIIAMWLGASIWFLWWLLVAWVVVGSGIWFWRYRLGAWESMKVIEE